MLMYHSDSQIDGLLGAVNLNLFSVIENRTRCGRIHPIQYVHKRTLSRTVFSKDRMYLSLVYR